MLLTGSIFSQFYTHVVFHFLALLYVTQTDFHVAKTTKHSPLCIFLHVQQFSRFFAKLNIKNKILLQETVGDLEAFLKLVYRVKNLVTHAHWWNGHKSPTSMIFLANFLGNNRCWGVQRLSNLFISDKFGINSQQDVCRLLKMKILHKSTLTST